MFAGYYSKEYIIVDHLFYKEVCNLNTGVRELMITDDYGNMVVTEVSQLLFFFS